MKNIERKEGITLIALVITIIVMLILVAVTITIAVNGGLFEYAGKAEKETKIAIQDEKNLTNFTGDLSTDELIERFTNENVNNPYSNETPGCTWICKNGWWYEWGQVEGGDVIARMYEKGTINVNGVTKPAHHLVIEKMENGSGEMGNLSIAAYNKEKILIASIRNSDMPHSFYIAAKEPTIDDPNENCGWNLLDFRNVITKVIICSGVKSIGGNAFKYMTSINEVVIPESIISIADDAFSGCTSLSSIKIPRSVTTIGNNAFLGVPHIEYNGTATGSPWGALTIN